MRIVFLGTGEIGVPSLQALAASGSHEVCAVFTQPDRPAGRDMKVRPSPVKLAALELGIPVFQPERIRRPDALEVIAGLAPDLIIVVAYGQILPKTLLDLPPRGCLNIHASLLPRHRGASPINAAILAGDHETGLTIMWMDEGLDTGDILLKETTPIGPHETAGALHDRLALLAPEALFKALHLIETGTAPREKQNDALATHAPKLTRKDGEIDWHQPAHEIDRRLRGLTPWPGAFTYLPGPPPELLKIHLAAVAESYSGAAGTILGTSPEGILVAADTDALLLQEVQVAGGKRLKAAEFLRGRPLPMGMRFSE
ncbi:MAG: methionyl-tRNA formyltransferase [Terrimicrobiaceae bacterium]